MNKFAELLHVVMASLHTVSVKVHHVVHKSETVLHCVYLGCVSLHIPYDMAAGGLLTVIVLDIVLKNIGGE